MIKVPENNSSIEYLAHSSYGPSPPSAAIKRAKERGRFLFTFCIKQASIRERIVRQLAFAWPHHKWSSNSDFTPIIQTIMAINLVHHTVVREFTFQQHQRQSYSWQKSLITSSWSSFHHRLLSCPLILFRCDVLFSWPAWKPFETDRLVCWWLVDWTRQHHSLLKCKTFGHQRRGHTTPVGEGLRWSDLVVRVWMDYRHTLLATGVLLELPLILFRCPSPGLFCLCQMARYFHNIFI